jgi:tyrosine-protein kinase Etk/Wzc
VATGGVQVVRRAAVPTAPAPRLSPLMAAVALILGLALAAVAVAVLERFDRRLLDEAAVRDGLGLPVIARVPAGGRRRHRDRAEALDALAARLRFVAPGKKAQVVMVAPAADYSVEDLATELAAALAGFESWVMLVDADLARRRPDRDVIDDGLTGVLCGSRKFEDALVPVFLPDDGDGRGSDAWHLLPAGRGVGRPMPLLASGEMRQVVATARENADVILIIAPPLTRAGEALAVAALADEIVVVARPRWTTCADADRVREVLGAAGVRVAGLVLECARRRLRRGGWVEKAPLMLAEPQASGQAPEPVSARA